jgi:hypothetical protein
LLSDQLEHRRHGRRFSARAATLAFMFGFGLKALV